MRLVEAVVFVQMLAFPESCAHGYGKTVNLMRRQVYTNETRLAQKRSAPQDRFLETQWRTAKRGGIPETTFVD
jgi:hypothetical protein